MESSPNPSNRIADWRIPIVPEGDLELALDAGQVITVVGANGSGKSALASRLADGAPNDPRAMTGEPKLSRLLAHRTVTIASSATMLTPASRKDRAASLAWENIENRARYADNMGVGRVDILLYDLISSKHLEDSKYADIVEANPLTEDLRSQFPVRMLNRVNAVLEAAGILVSIEITDTQSLLARHRSLGNTYEATQMSDGERAALILIAQVLTAVDGAVIMLDEPERHLHRSISPRLIAALVEARPDCGFVVFTHDLDLASTLSMQNSHVLATLGVEWEGEDAVRWEVRELRGLGEEAEDVRRGILGGRQQVMFIEGTVTSLDRSLYRTLFPEYTQVPSGSCEHVIRNVAGVKSSVGFHWVNAIGVVDGDERTMEERRQLREKEIHVLKVNEIESLFYHSSVLRAVAEMHKHQFEASVEDVVQAAKRAALDALLKAGVLEHITRTQAKKIMTRRVVEQIPTADVNSWHITVSSPYSDIFARNSQYVAAGDYDSIVAALPVRDSGFTTNLAKKLGFLDKSVYATVALSVIERSPKLRHELRSLVIDAETGGSTQA